MTNDPQEMLARLVAWYLNVPYDETMPPEPFKDLREEGRVCFMLSDMISFMEDYLKNHGLK
jgi:hypothetical protein